MASLPRLGENELPEYRRQLALDFFPFLEGPVRGRKLGKITDFKSLVYPPGMPQNRWQEGQAEVAGTSRDCPLMSSRANLLVSICLVVMPALQPAHSSSGMHVITDPQEAPHRVSH